MHLPRFCAFSEVRLLAMWSSKSRSATADSCLTGDMYSTYMYTMAYKRFCHILDTIQ